MNQRNNKVIPVATCLLVKENKTFLLRRFNTGWADGLFTPPAGHVDPDETPTAAAIREAQEEAGVKISAENLKPVQVLYRKSDDGTGNVYVDFVFSAQQWDGQPTNNEPEKSDLAGWFELDNLPENMKPFMKETFKNYRTGQFYSESWAL